ncbi:hypothetical protein D3C87_1652290 [compost metagenome]
MASARVVAHFAQCIGDIQLAAVVLCDALGGHFHENVAHCLLRTEIGRRGIFFLFMNNPCQLLVGKCVCFFHFPGREQFAYLAQMFVGFFF